jgi:hypothetical protein
MKNSDIYNELKAIGMHKPHGVTIDFERRKKERELFRDFKKRSSNAKINSTQDPDELFDYLCELYSWKKYINSYYEVGCSKGGTFYIVTAFLKLCNPDFKTAVACDIRDKIRDFDSFYNQMKSVGVDVGFEVHNSQKMKVEGNWDLVFIDGNHSFEGVLTDYVKWKPHAKFMAFHDISYRGGRRLCGVPSAWNLIRQNYDDYREFINLDTVYDYPQGIGFLDHADHHDDHPENWYERYLSK